MKDDDVDVTVDPIDKEMLVRDSVAIAPGVMIPRRFRARVTGDTLDVILDVVVPTVGALTPAVERVATTAKLLASRGYGQGVTGATLRSVPVAAVLKAATRQVVWVPDASGDPVFVFSRDGSLQFVAPWGTDIDRRALLTRVATLYLVAEAIGDGPTAAVAKAAGVSRATAGRWVDEARKAKLLPPALSRETAEFPDPDAVYFGDEPLGEVDMVSLPKNYAEVESWYRDHDWPSTLIRNDADSD